MIEPRVLKGFLELFQKDVCSKQKKKGDRESRKYKHKVNKLKDNDKPAAQNDQNTVCVNVSVRHCFCCVITFRAQFHETDV